MKTSGNYYEWRARLRGETAMDGNGYRHPDGSECEAKVPEACPFRRKELSDLEVTEKLDADMENGIDNHDDNPTDLYARHLREMREALTRHRDLLEKVGCGNLKLGDLEKAYNELEGDMKEWNHTDDQTITDARKSRDELWHKYENEPYASYNILTGEDAWCEDGWGVTFQTTGTEDPKNSNYLDNAAYDRKCEQMRTMFDCAPNVGVYEGSCEISYCCKNTARSIAAMVMLEQKAIYSYKGKDCIVNHTFDKRVNNLVRPQDE